MLVAFCVSLAFFNDANIDASVPLAYPLLALPARCACCGSGCAAPGAGRRGPLRCSCRSSWLASALVFLVGFRVGLNVANSNVIDVGYAGVIGADRMADGEPLYGTFPKDNQHGDTYGPVTYAAYVPVRAGPAVERDAGTTCPPRTPPRSPSTCCALGALFLLGRRHRAARRWASRSPTRGRRTRSRSTRSNTNANDALVAVLVARRAARRRVARRRAARWPRSAGLTKFAPLALAPLLATYGLERGARRCAARAAFALGFAGVARRAAAGPRLRATCTTFYDRTLGFQADRGSPFSIWGLYGTWARAQAVVQVAGGRCSRWRVAFVPRRRDVVGLAALRRRGPHRARSSA